MTAIVRRAQRPARHQRTDRLAAESNRSAAFQRVVAQVRRQNLTGRHRARGDLRLQAAAPVRDQRHERVAVVDEERDGRRPKPRPHQRAHRRRHAAVLVGRLAQAQDLDDVVRRRPDVAAGTSAPCGGANRASAPSPVAATCFRTASALGTPERRSLRSAHRALMVAGRLPDGSRFSRPSSAVAPRVTTHSPMMLGGQQPRADRDERIPGDSRGAQTDGHVALDRHVVADGQMGERETVRGIRDERRIARALGGLQRADGPS